MAAMVEAGRRPRTVIVWSSSWIPYLACPLTLGFALSAPFGAAGTYRIPRRPPCAKGLQRSFIPLLLGGRRTSRRSRFCEQEYV
jgi:hypothetical protein